MDAKATYRQRAKHDRAKAKKFAQRLQGKYILSNGPKETYYSKSMEKRDALVDRLLHQGKLHKDFKLIDP